MAFLPWSREGIGRNTDIERTINHFGSCKLDTYKNNIFEMTQNNIQTMHLKLQAGFRCCSDRKNEIKWVYISQGES